ncbi:hypothetical protein P8452_74151 [Trifolium repens]|nr:hypothetical protein P8452_74151 [Trifolium repens]
MSDWGPVFVSVVLFILLTPGLLVQIPGVYYVLQVFTLTYHYTINLSPSEHHRRISPEGQKHVAFQFPHFSPLLYT